MNDEVLYDYVNDLLSHEIKNEPLWIKAYALSDGNEHKTKFLYISYLISELKETLEAKNINYGSLSKYEISQYIDNTNQLYDDKYIKLKNEEYIPGDTVWIETLVEWAEEYDIKGILQYKNELSSITSLDLSRKNLCFLPKEIENLQELKTLNLYDNNLKGISIYLSCLPNLTFLHIGKNNIENISYDSSRLYPSIKQLFLSQNNITDFKFLLSFPNLNELSLRDSNINEFPKEILQLETLEELHMSRNNIKFLPAKINQLKNLLVLDIEENELTDLPVEIGQLSQLNRLNLNNNKLERIPDQISNLYATLYDLKLSNNDLKELPRSFIYNDSYRFDINDDSYAYYFTSIQLEILNNHNLSLYYDQKRYFREADAKSDEPYIIYEDEILTKQVIDWEMGIYIFAKKYNLEYLLVKKEDLVQITELDFSNMDFENSSYTIPVEIYNLKKLEKITLKNCKILYLYDGIKNLSNLKHLDVSNSYIRDLPKDISSLTELNSINITSCKQLELNNDQRLFFETINTIT